MQWILVFLSAIDPVIVPPHPMPGMRAGEPVVMARYASEQDCLDGQRALDKAMYGKLKVMTVSDNRFQCLPVGKAIN